MMPYPRDHASTVSGVANAENRESTTTETVRDDKKVAIVTGATCGLGREIARSLCARGFRVVLACLSGDEGRDAIADFPHPSLCEILVVDLSDLDSVRGFCATFKAEAWQLDLLFCNAGILRSVSCRPSPDGFDEVFATNYLGHFLMCHLLRPQLEKARGRVVMTSSVMHRWAVWPHLALSDAGVRGHHPEQLYPLSKLAQILHACEFQRRWPRISVMAVNPGGMASQIWNRALPLQKSLSRLILPHPSKIAEAMVATAIARPPNREASYYNCPVLACILPFGLGEYYGPVAEVCLEAEPSAAAKDPALASRLYESSLRWVEVAPS